MRLVFSTAFVILMVFVAAKSQYVAKEYELSRLPRYQGIIDFTDSYFDAFADKEPRNYSLILLVGTRNEDCYGCQLAQEAMEVIASSWEYYNPKEGGLYFGFIDFAISKNTIRKLNIQTAPFAIHYPYFGQPSKLDRNDKSEELVSVPAFNRWIKLRTGRTIIVKKTLDLTILKYTTGFLAVFFVPIVFKLATLRTMIAMISLGFIFSMLSGAMWISINSPPWVSRDGSRVMYYTHGRSQLGSETCIIFGLYACTNIGMILLGQKCRKLLGLKHIVSVLVCLCMAGLGFNQLAEYYSLKHGGLQYHYSLL